MKYENLSEGSFQNIVIMIVLVIAYQLALELLSIEFVYKHEDYKHLIQKFSDLLPRIGMPIQE